MSVRRLSNIYNIPHAVTKAFRNANKPKSPEEILWREVAARITLDGLGYTGLTGEPDKHDHAVREARRWFRGIPVEDSPEIVFDYAAMTNYYPGIRTAVLNHPVTYALDVLYEELEDESYDDALNDLRQIEELDPEFSGFDGGE